MKVDLIQAVITTIKDLIQGAEICSHHRGVRHKDLDQEVLALLKDLLPVDQDKLLVPLLDCKFHTCKTRTLKR